MKRIILLLILMSGIFIKLTDGKIEISFHTASAQFYGSEIDEWGNVSLFGDGLPDFDTGTDVLQQGNLCVATTMEYISDFYGMNLNQIDLAYDYADMMGRPNDINWAITNGVHPNNFENFVGNYFSFNNLDIQNHSYMGALDLGHPIMGTYETPTSYHEVMIIGHDPIEYRVKYLDPQDGQYKQKDASEFVKMLEIYPPN